MKNVGLADIFFKYLTIKDLEGVLLIFLLKIFSNLFSSDEIIIYFIKDKNGEILKVFISIIKYLFTFIK